MKQAAVKEETTPARVETSVDEKIGQANEAFNNYLKYQGQKEFQKAADALERLQSILKELSDRSKNTQEKK